MSQAKVIRSLFCLGVLGVLAVQSPAADWPQWRGPNRDDVSTEKGLLKTWPKEGPPLRWTFRNAGVGYSGPSVVGDRLYILGGRDGSEVLLALDTRTGKELWQARLGPIFTFDGNSWGDGPRSTPTVDGDAVFALGGQGVLICVDAS